MQVRAIVAGSNAPGPSSTAVPRPRRPNIDENQDVFSFLRRHHSLPAISPIARRVRDGRLTYLKDAKLTLHPQTEIAFAHIDCDWYDPVKLCLARIVPRLSAGAYVVLDDYNDYGGCRRAVDEFLQAGPGVDIVAREPNFVFRRRGGGS